jgi:hypothetical protein
LILSDLLGFLAKYQNAKEAPNPNPEAPGNNQAPSPNQTFTWSLVIGASLGFGDWVLVIHFSACPPKPFGEGGSDSV